ncbi:MAG: limonene-1,2-epoxide hydrolase family protein [Sporichthyaceae bacterium]
MHERPDLPWVNEKTSAAAPVNDDERTTVAFLADVCRGDADAMAAWFSEEAMYQNMPLPPAYGRTAIVETLRGLYSLITIDHIDVLYLASRDGFVLNERIDWLRAGPDATLFPLPVSSTVQLVDGKVAAWRDYFDLREFEEAVGLPLRALATGSGA